MSSGHENPGWIEFALGDIAMFVNGFGFSQSQWQDIGDPIIRIENMRDPAAEFNRYPGTLPERYKVDSGDILLSWSATLMALIWNRGPAWVNQHIFKVSPKRVTDPKFLYHLLSYVLIDLSAQSHGTTMRHIKRSDLLPFRVRIPPVSEQHRIAEILETADEAIRSTERLIAKLEQAKQGLLHDLLTCGIDGFGELRNPHGSPGNFVESPLGLIPRSWRVSPVRDLALKVTDGDHHTPRKSANGIQLLGAGNVQDGSLDLSNAEYVDESEYARMIKRCHPEIDDILISCSGSIGRVARVPPRLRLALVRSVALIKVDTSKCTATFLEIALRSPMVQRQIRNAQKQMAQPNLFQGPISELIIPLPEPSEQKAIAERVLSYETTSSISGRELRKFQIVKQGLMDDLLTGRVRVGASG